MPRHLHSDITIRKISVHAKAMITDTFKSFHRFYKLDLQVLEYRLSQLFSLLNQGNASL